MQGQCKYPIELVKKETVSTFGKCMIPKSIMKELKIQNGKIVTIQSRINDLVHFLLLFVNK